ncbi:hypothetical protein MKX01_026789 [Papaver californicum]|nr:hypothetical protein MKX01_026789 [Papaver californicum]
MKLIIGISVMLMCLLLSNIFFVGAAPTYQCKKEMTGIFRGPCKTHCEQFYLRNYNGIRECDEQIHKCVCTYSSPIFCDS